MTAETPLRIAVLGHVRHPVARPFMGGMEAHCWHLCHALTARGHDVTLFAAGDSDAAGRLHPVLPRHYETRYPWHDWNGTPALNAVLDAGFAGILGLLREGGFDVVHNNSLHRFPPRLARRDGLPMVTSLHVPPFDVLARAVRGSAAPWARFTICSELQRRRWWPDGAPPQAHVVPNGIDLAVWPYRSGDDGRAVWSGRITPTKGAGIAVQAARAAGIDLTLFGTIEHRDHFEADVKPHLSSSVRYGGHLSQAELAAEIGAASVFLFTPLWDEPFGLAAAEAMACGTPVAALPRGAVQEVVGRGGVVASDVTPDALVAALRRALEMPRAEVHAWAAARFGRDAMVRRYEDLYARAIAARPADPPRAPAFAPIELPPAPLREAAQ